MSIYPSHMGQFAPISCCSETASLWQPDLGGTLKGSGSMLVQTVALRCDLVMKG